MYLFSPLPLGKARQGEEATACLTYRLLVNPKYLTSLLFSLELVAQPCDWHGELDRIALWLLDYLFLGSLVRRWGIIEGALMCAYYIVDAEAAR